MTIMFERITIVGVGLIGGSLGQAARRCDPRPRVTGVDEPATVAAAIEAGAIDAGSDDLEAACRDAELVILARTVEGILADLGRLDRLLCHAALVLDVGSTKVEICRRAAALGDRPWRFIGGHPMAGAEKRGVAHARADLFRDRPFLLCPEPAMEPDAINRVERFLRALGARPHRLAPERHDFIVSAVSHLPQMVSVAMAGLLADWTDRDPDLVALAGPALRDMLRTAASDFGLWRGICATNRTEIEARLQEAETALRRLRENFVPGPLDDTFTAANRVAKRLQGEKE